MKKTWVVVTVQVTSAVVCGLVAAVLSGFTALMGAKMAGLQEGGWNFQMLPPLFFGWVGGAILTLGVGILVFVKLTEHSARLGWILISAPVVALFGGVVGHPIAEANHRHNIEESQRLARISEERQQQYSDQIKSDPGIVLRDEWYRARDERRLAYRLSLEDSTTQYTADILIGLYEADEDIRTKLLAHPAFDRDVLERKFRQELKNAKRGNCRYLVAILKNPSAKSEWFDEVVVSGVLEKDFPIYGSSLKRVVDKRTRSGSNKIR